MLKSTIAKLPILFLTRQRTFIQQKIKRKLTITPHLLQEKKKPNSSNFEKKIENKRKTFQEAKKKIYYKFLCKCGVGFNDFPEFLEHVKTSHQIKNLNWQEILTKKNGWERGIKFYWSLSCQCGHKFSSSLCNADLKVKEEQVEILKKYRLQCLKCKKYAKFDVETLLDKFLEERFKQKLIYNFYKKEFDKFENERDGKKMLEGHIEELCEKCKLLGRHCGSGLDQQEQVSQIGYVPPFRKW
ncbi:conserved protein of unknown function [endosymbiont DhMRE of Dentiscutata heterogama]|uniref:3CxxC-type zinc finger protein n=1 Tax=endosymbiont DhMRE of Dentiscutata heterogama TaxID=1609546 RepID=UPI000637FD17|nr:3CxxC-type zinc finger protein [endosymbiont DhMRE of Dentiscutata heterogama]CFW92713.1 conserved protein of unknown function [endosymbiont DhMRE of Dentiscutata heterogama]